MYGKSWGGFNSLMLAMRNPPALKAIVAVHASEDLYSNDIHQIDGAPHWDEYILSMDQENALPRTPIELMRSAANGSAGFDAEYIKDRWNAIKPWTMTYLDNQVSVMLVSICIMYLSVCICVFVVVCLYVCLNDSLRVCLRCVFESMCAGCCAFWGVVLSLSVSMCVPLSI